MVGGAPNPGYRRHLNLLSQRYYTRSPGRYIAIPARAIVTSAAAQYDFEPRLSNKIHRERPQE
jgi:hypothetical protein